MSKTLRTCVIPVGGLGTRFLPATKSMPKEMLTVVDKPLIQYAVEEAAVAGFDQIVLVTARGKTVLIDHFDVHPELEAVLESKGKIELLEQMRALVPAGVRVMSVRQGIPLGLGHAIWCAWPIVGDQPFGVILPDDLILADKPCLAQMAEAWKDLGGHVVAVEDVPREHTSRYGVLDIAEDKGAVVKARSLVEKPKPEEAPSNTTIIGRYILDPSVFPILAQGIKGAGGEIQLTDAMVRTIGAVDFHGYRYQGTRYDCGNKMGFVAANVAYALARDDMRDEVIRLLGRAGLVTSS